MAFLTWAAVAASAVFWGLRLLVPGAPTPAPGLAAARPPAVQADVGRVLGAAQAAAQPATGSAQASAAQGRFRLVGVVAAAGAGAAPGLALLSIDGKAARSFRVGAPVDGDWVLQGVDAGSARLGPERGTTALTLELPRAPQAARGQPPAGGRPAAPGGPLASAAPAAGSAATPSPATPGSGTPAGDAAQPGGAPAEGSAPAVEPAAGERVPNPEPGALRRPGPLTR